LVLGVWADAGIDIGIIRSMTSAARTT